MTPLNLSLTNCTGAKLKFDEQDRSFIAGCDKGEGRVFLLEKKHGLWGSEFVLRGLNGAVAHPADLAPDFHSRRLFVIDVSAAALGEPLAFNREELIEYNFGTSSFRPFLPGVFARDVDFSPDGRVITYVRAQDLTLWLSLPDGSDAKQIDFKAEDVELPRWSPDGKWIAFMARISGRPFRVFVVPASGGVPHEASSGTDNQGAPTWSRDSKWLVYGNVRCQENGTCAIHKIDLSNGQLLTVPGSEGLGTARWSPDGQSIAALSAERQEVWFFNEKTQRWRNLTGGVNGNDLSWSLDSRYLFASNPSGA